jgi:2-polyprenyl-3-methyl-5-hydroxy-6-metoxy-1,4-benzoquinol methylase
MGASRVRWEEVDCPLCGVDDEELLLTAPDEIEGRPCRLVRCRACGMGYLNPRPAAASLGLYYRSDYGPYQPRLPDAPGAWESLRRRGERLVLAAYHGYPGVRLTFAGRLLAAILRPWLGPGRDSHTSILYHGGGRLLDFGCGSGWFAYRMYQQGWDVTGVDFSDHAARQVRDVYGIPVHVGTLPHADIAPESFDVVHMGSVLEHVPDPHAVVAAAAAALVPGGYLAVAVPNLDAWSIRAYGAGSFIVDLPRHLLHFTAGTLRELLDRHGLEIEQMRMPRRVSSMRRTLADGARHGKTRLARWLGRLGRLRLVSSAVTAWASATGQGDYLFCIARRPLHSLAPFTATAAARPAGKGSPRRMDAGTGREAGSGRVPG